MIKQLKLLLSSFFLLIFYIQILLFPEESIHYIKTIGIFITGLTLLGIYISIRKQPENKWIFFFPISLIHSYFLFYSTTDSLMQNIMGRPFSFIDAVYLNDLYNLLRDSYGLLPAVLVSGLIVFIPVLLVIINYIFLTELGKIWIRSGMVKSNLLITFSSLLLLITLSLITKDNIWTPGIIEAKNIITLSSRKQEIDTILTVETSRRKETVNEQSVEGYPLDKLKGNNVFIFIIESYGRTLFENSDNWVIAEPEYEVFEQNLITAGYNIASSSLESPAIGGNSWLADSTLNSGVWVADQTVYDKLIQSELPVLGTYFNDAGYKTVIAQPGMRESGDEEYFYNFDRTYNYSDFNYEGPSFVWATMSDQYVIDFIDRKEVRVGEKPLFAQYVLISSHFPFQLIPAYIENWSLLGNGTIYTEENMIRKLPIPEGRKTAGPYGLTISLLYVMEVITQYLINHLENPGLVIILGDHQPYSKVTGPYGGKQVAIHVLAKKAELLEPFIKRGYTKGLISPAQESAIKMDKFLPAFLSDFSSTSIF